MRFRPVVLLSAFAVTAACSSDPMDPRSSAPPPAFAFTGTTSNIVNSWFQGFEVNSLDWSISTTTQVPSGTNGVASSTDAFHAEALQGAFSRFGGYSSVWPGNYLAEVNVYLDPTWAVGQGFDFAVASSASSGGHLRDFIFHVGVVPGGALLVNGDNNTYGSVNAFVLSSGTPYTVTTAGWYTLQHIFYDDGGVLAVDMNLINSTGTVLFTITRKTLTDLIPSVVGGNRYAWFVISTRTLAIDNHRLGRIFPLPGSKDDCKNGGFVTFGFRNQGQCVASFNHS